MYHQSTPKKSSFRHGGSCGSASTTPSGGSPQQQRASSQHQAVNSPGHRSSSISSSSGRENRSDSCSSGGSIIIAIDASHQAELAFQWYLDNLHRPGNRIYILHSIDLSEITVRDDKETCDATFEQSWHKEKGKIRALEDKYQWKLNENGISGKIQTVSGKPGEVIIRAAMEQRAGMIVIGSRGLSKLQRTFACSVSDYVLHHSPCPVVICRQSE